MGDGSRSHDSGWRLDARLDGGFSAIPICLLLLGPLVATSTIVGMLRECKDAPLALEDLDGSSYRLARGRDGDRVPASRREDAGTLLAGEGGMPPPTRRLNPRLVFRRAEGMY